MVLSTVSLGQAHLDLRHNRAQGHWNKQVKPKKNCFINVSVGLWEHKAPAGVAQDSTLNLTHQETWWGPNTDTAHSSLGTKSPSTCGLGSEQWQELGHLRPQQLEKTSPRWVMPRAEEKDRVHAEAKSKGTAQKVSLANPRMDWEDCERDGFLRLARLAWCLLRK